MSLPARVTVLLPFRNAAATLGPALASVLCQTETAWRLVAVDDGSQDESAALVARGGRGDPRVCLVSSPPVGLVAALNLGLSHVDTPFVARMDADDRCHPKRLERQLACLAAHPETTVVGCRVRCFPRALVQAGMRAYEAWQNSLTSHADIVREIFIEAPLVHPSVVLRTAALRAVGGYRAGPFPEDYDLWLRLFEAGAGFAKVAAPLFAWRESGGRLTRTDPRYSPAAILALKAHYLRRTVLRDAPAVQIWGAGRDGKRLARALGGEGVPTARFFDVDPAKIGGRVGGRIPVLPYAEVARHRELPLLIGVGARGARALIRPELGRLGRVEGHDAWFVG